MDQKMTCKTCERELPEGEFYTSNKSKCKECTRAAVKANRAAKSEYYKEYDRKRFQEDPRARERHKRYRATESGKAAMKKAQKKWLSQNPEKRAAHVILNNRIRDGHVVKPDKCSKCGDGRRIEGHHDDYSKPLEVVWLCRQCHVDTHKDV